MLRIRKPASAQRRLAEGMRQRDPRALDEIYREHAGTVLGYLRGTLRDRGMAEDVHQQVFLEVWQRAPDYDPRRGGLLTWILTIARSRTIDELRRRVPEPRDPSETLDVADAPAGEEFADRLVEQWQVAHLLGQLRREESMLLRLRFHYGLSQSEIAERVELPLGTVKMRMVQALQRLRELMEAEEPATRARTAHDPAPLAAPGRARA